VVNNKLYVHTAPDHAEFWQPLRQLANLEGEEQRRFRESVLWSRKIWGFDYYSGMRTLPFTQEELEHMLSGFGVEAIVVGHTPITHDPMPVSSYQSKVINIDLHGIPGSRPFVEVYSVDSKSVRREGLEGPVHEVLRVL